MTTPPFVNTLFSFPNKEPVYEFFRKKMALFLSSFWFSLTALFAFMTNYLFRFWIDDNFQDKNFTSSEVFDDQIDDSMPELEEDYEFEEKELSPKFSFKFQFQTFDDIISSSGGELETNTSKFEFLPKKDVSGYMEEPEVVSFTVKELFLNSDEGSLDDKEILDNGFLSENDFLQKFLDREDVGEEIVNSSYSGEDVEKPESIALSEVPLFEKEQSINSDSNSPEKEDFGDEGRFIFEDELVSSDSEPEIMRLWDKFSVMVDTMDSDSDAFLSDGDFDGGVEVEPETCEGLDESKGQAIDEFQISEEMHTESQRVLAPGGMEVGSPASRVHTQEGHEATDLDEILEMIDDIKKLEELNLPHSSRLDSDDLIDREFREIQGECAQEDSRRDDIKKLEELNLPHSSRLDSDDRIDREFREIQGECTQEDSRRDDIEKPEELHLPRSSRLDSNDWIDREFREIQAECEREDLRREEAEASVSCEISEESTLQDSSSSESGDSSSLETLWEHQDLIEQLKMEIRKVRATGLPTILEESESPRMSEDLKPWKIDEKVVHEDQMKGLRKFYRSYKEKMRKLDILNYQKMYAIGFLKLKDPLQSMSTQKSFAPNLMSLLSQNFLLPKRRRPEEDSSLKFMRELESDLELVYVGHLCLSWEFLHWQYLKARELLVSDPYEIRPYNQVAVELQQFQVYMQRFLEYEPFQGPRVQNYVKNRCVMRTLLEVPVIKEDPMDKEGRKRTKDAITCSMLLKIIEESMQIFWQFVRADKHDDSIIFKGLSRPQVKFPDRADAELLVDVQTNLQKKEKKLKDILRSGNCLVKKFQKQPKEPSDQLLFFPQVDLKLVSRVLRMSKITSDQLAWCHKKLERISFVQRKIQVEPSFLLFPC